MSSYFYVCCILLDLDYGSKHHEPRSVLNTFEKSMENGAFAEKSKCFKRANAPFSIIFFKYMIFQRRQKALLWSQKVNENDMKF